MWEKALGKMINDIFRKQLQEEVENEEKTQLRLVIKKETDILNDKEPINSNLFKKVLAYYKECYRHATAYYKDGSYFDTLNKFSSQLEKVHHSFF